MSNVVVVSMAAIPPIDIRVGSSSIRQTFCLCSKYCCGIFGLDTIRTLILRQSRSLSKITKRQETVAFRYT